MNIQILKNGAPLEGPVLVKGDLSANQPLVVQHKDGAAAAGKQVKIGTSCVTFVTPVEGVLDANGRWSFVVGPSFGAKGDAELTVRIGNKSRVVNVRFTD